MNSRKVRYSCFLVCLSVLLGFSWSAPAVADEPIDRRFAAGPISGGGVGATKPAPSVPAKPLPAGTPLAAPKTSQPAQAAAQPVEPAWPQPFELGPGEQTGFAFVVGNPGLIVVNVRWTGVPLTATLAKPGGVFIYQQGNGSMTLQHNATVDDVKKGVLWGVSIRPTQVVPKSAAGTGIAVIEKPVKIDTRGLAKGTVNVQHPPGDMNLAQAELKARTVKAQALKPTSQAVATATVNVLAQRQAALQKQQTARQAALLEQVRSKISVPAYQEMSQRIASGTAASGVPLKQKTGVAVRATGTSAQADVSSAGSNAPATIATDPVITALSVTSGQPGDPVLIEGSGFSNIPGEVHFIVANGRDVVAPVTIWSDTQIFAAVPEVSGIQAFNGLVSVKRGTSTSKLVPFRFIPSIECIILNVIPINDQILQNADPAGYYVRHPGPGWAFFLGARGDDTFFSNTRLKNGWTLQAVYLTDYGNYSGIKVSGAADAYVSESSPGTDSLYAKVHWWIDADAWVLYTPIFEISGPKGVPYF